MSDDNWQQKNRELSALDQVKADAERRFSIGVHDGQSCEKCRFWHGKHYAGGGPWAPSACLRHAPHYETKYIFAESDQAHDPSNKHFPTTLYDDWCGDFEALK